MSATSSIMKRMEYGPQSQKRWTIVEHLETDLTSPVSKPSMVLGAQPVLWVNKIISSQVKQVVGHHMYYRKEALRLKAYDELMILCVT